MATNKNALLRYSVLDRCFRNKQKRYSIMDLLEACNQALYEHYGSSVAVKKRQIYKDISFMESEAGWSIPLEKIKNGNTVYYRYDNADFSIYQCPLKDNELQSLKQAVMTLKRLKGLPQYDWLESLVANLEDKLKFKGQDKYAIGFDQNIDYSGSSYIAELFNAILDKQVVRIDYSTFKNEHYVWDIHPYYLKQYNNRWFLLGYNDEYPEQVVTIPLDRINKITQINTPYIEKEIDFDEYFDDVIGVTIPKHKTVETIILRISPKDYPYITSKPPHGSMRMNDKEYIIKLELIPNYELEALILSYGDGVEVLEPKWFRDKIKGRIKALLSFYQ